MDVLQSAENSDMSCLSARLLLFDQASDDEMEHADEGYTTITLARTEEQSG